MKTFQILIIIFLWNGVAIGQNIIINDFALGGINIPFHDTSIYYYNYVDDDYLIDLDGNGTDDVMFSYKGDVGGPYNYREISITTYNEFDVHLDTNYFAPAEFIDTNGTLVSVLTKYTVINNYLPSDTLFYNAYSSNQKTYLLNTAWTGYGTSIQWENINYIYGDTSYIGFTKDDGQSLSLYYIQVFINSSYINLISAKTNDITFSIAEKSKKSYNFYPNPASNFINIDEDYKMFEIYTLQGCLILTGNISVTNNSLNISSLRSGYYLLKLKNNTNEVITKFIKK
jgi:hypothetical protein